MTTPRASALVTTTDLTGPDLSAVRGRWQHQATAPGPAAVLRIALLASYTIDPLTPYLGVALTEAGLTPDFQVGPFNQIVQECLDESSVTARFRPDVLVVAPRLEELVPAGGDPAGYRGALGRVLDVATAAARRGRSSLVVVLPAIPEHHDHGALDDGLAGSVPAAAAAAREFARARLADRPDAWVVDAERAVRAVGARAAYHDALFQFARVPYTEPVFAALAAQLAGVLRAVYGATPRALVVDADGLADVTADPDAGAALTGSLRLLRSSGTRLGVLGTREGSWRALTTAVPDVVELLDAWRVDRRPAGESLPDLAAALGVPADSTVLLTAAAGPETERVVRLEGPPRTWPATLNRAGLLDRLPVPAPEPAAGVPIGPAGDETAGDDAAGDDRTDQPLSLADFIAGLELAVDYEPVRPATAANVAEVVSRAKDFTLGLAGTAVDRTALDGTGSPAGDGELLAIRVRDRFGDYGIGGAVRIRPAGAEQVVDVFSLSCVVLGKGVPERVLADLLARAGGAPVVVRYRRTPHNRVATDFLGAAAPAAAGSAPLRLEEVP